VLINFIPFVLLEAIWTVVSVYGVMKVYRALV